MDDLLSFMASPDEADDATPSQGRPTTARDNEIHREGLRRSNTDVTRKSHSSMPTSNRESSSAIRSIKKSNKDSTTVDSFTNIRIVSRQISRVEMVDVFSQYQFHTTTNLASMSKYDLSKLLVETPNNLDDGVSGRTNMATSGIVFHNSSTRIGKSGRAFNIIKIGGDLDLGPSISVFLFGSAYSKYVTKVKPGHVVAILASSIMPSRTDKGNQYGGDTRITLSIQDEQQLLIVGNALDYGVCCGKNKQWKSGQESTRCKNFVDLRVGKYCRYHAKRQDDTTGATRSTQSRNSMAQKSNMTFVQAMKANVPTRNGIVQSPGTMTMPKVDMKKVHMNSRIPQRSGFSDSVQGVKESLEKMVSRHPRSNNASNEKVLRLNPTTKLLKNQINGAPAQSNTNTNVVMKPKVVNQSNRDTLGQMIKQSCRQTSQTPASRQLNTTKKRRAQDTAQLSGFDGQVQVPRPNPLFNRTSSNPGKAFMRPSSQASVSQDSKQLNSILERQKLLAQGIRVRSNPISNIAIKSSGTKHVDSNSLGAIFGTPMNDDMKAKILATRSRFSDEADAEVYARSRRAVTELEKKEGALEKRQSQMKKNAKVERDGMINTIWVCVTCKKTSSFKPQKCIQSNHTLKKKREIKRKECKSEKRTNLVNKSVEDGGLKLGAGIEWSRQSDFYM